MPYLRLEKDNDVAVVWMDQEGEKVNKLGDYLLGEFTAVLDDLSQDNSIVGAVLISGKPDTFIAGADLERVNEITEPGAIQTLVKQGHALFNRLENFRIPVVAAINGAALGGGLEVAMACHYRIATDSPKTILGQPEVQLGLLPGGGGTQRLPRLVGLQKSLDMMLTGKNIYPRQGKKMGLVDQVCSPYALLDAAKQAARDLARKPRKEAKRKPSFFDKVLEGTALTRKMAYKKAREMAEKQTRGHYPAPMRIIDCVEAGLEDGIQAGLAAEAKYFEELWRTPQSAQLRNIFFAMTALKKNPNQDLVKPVDKIGVLGAGLMGAGIAQISASKGIDVLMKDLDFDALGRGKKTIWGELDRRFRKKALSAFQRDSIFSRVDGVIEYAPLGKSDMVIEAVFEDLDLKRRVLADTEAVTPDHCIFASNTSSLPIKEIAKNASRPTQVIGMHYFSPVPKMPLLEIIVTPKTAKWVVATAVDVGIKQGKTVIVVKDGPGFYTTRVLAPMLNEALLLLEEGGDIENIDRVMRKLGWPVGPVTLIDEVGIDVGAHVTEVLSKMFAKRGVSSTDAMGRLLAEGYKGRKNGKGFYKYEKGSSEKGKKEVNTAVYEFFGGSTRKRHNAEEIRRRLMLVFCNEAARCLEEKILLSARDGDIGAIMGLGFPPYLGGPFRYMDQLGTTVVLEALEALAVKHGPRFTPAKIIAEKAADNGRFYDA